MLTRVWLMEDQIINKLELELAEPMTTERQVVYFLVEIRKLLDKQGKKGDLRYSSLRLYCNWAAHIELSQRQASEIVKQVDALYPKLMNGTLSDDEKNGLRERFLLTTFRAQLNDFLDELELRTLHDDEWNSFLACFLNVIQDCPLVCKTRGAVSHVDEITLTSELGEDNRIPDGNPPQLVWALSLRGNPQFMFTSNFSLSAKAVDDLVDWERARAGGPAHGSR